ncbi:hypothetical protein [Streptomyces sp. NPDC046685]|uniref:hypothetical protein n=1 Tax=Streptomyces sp. NPDC046685 TaxID=3157202 RepID=UPI0033FAD774
MTHDSPRTNQPGAQSAARETGTYLIFRTLAPAEESAVNAGFLDLFVKGAKLRATDVLPAETIAALGAAHRAESAGS